MPKLAMIMETARAEGAFPKFLASGTDVVRAVPDTCFGTRAASMSEPASNPLMHFWTESRSTVSFSRAANAVTGLGRPS